MVVLSWHSQMRALPAEFLGWELGLQGTGALNNFMSQKTDSSSLWPKSLSPPVVHPTGSAGSPYLHPSSLLGGVATVELPVWLPLWHAQRTHTCLCSAGRNIEHPTMAMPTWMSVSYSYGHRSPSLLQGQFWDKGKIPLNITISLSTCELLSVN